MAKPRKQRGHKARTTKEWLADQGDCEVKEFIIVQEKMCITGYINIETGLRLITGARKATTQDEIQYRNQVIGKRDQKVITMKPRRKDKDQDPTKIIL